MGKYAVGDRLGDLVELERRNGERAVREVALKAAAVELGCVLEIVGDGLLDQRMMLGQREFGTVIATWPALCTKNSIVLISHEVRS